MLRRSQGNVGVLMSRGVSSGVFTHLKMGPPDAILGVTQAFLKDNNPNKINLGVGAYRDGEGKPFVLESVKEASKSIVDMNHEYSPIGGTKEFTDNAAKLLLGENSSHIKDNKRVTVQTLSGTGALNLAGAFIARFLPGKKILLPDPTWANHLPIFKDAGIEISRYRYYKDNGLDLSGMLQDLESADEGSVVLLHACAHNPTGVDPNLDQWKEISKVCDKKNLTVLFDCAYQGFASGNPEQDVAALRLFLQDGHSPLICQSFAKNFGMYGERVGALTVTTASPEESAKVDSQLKILIRPMYSNPPINGSRIVNTILSSEKMTKKWRTEVKAMADRIIAMRKDLTDELVKCGADENDWKHVNAQIGMFCYSGLSAENVDSLAKNHSVYLTRDGRISMAGVSKNNVQYLAKSIYAVLQ